MSNPLPKEAPLMVSSSIDEVLNYTQGKSFPFVRETSLKKTTFL